ncbi:hypothetical protein ABB37_08481 [Leptomonas pyrrhocoris]|uniref:Uncharacterized protein n=1 Tax=Leptomonas pyrrhocoris TaxID=157538 RepID=A0A0M9FTG9_LEPPY|nr:hypothetical protein ABB37_08481 [Leptomonas pyrrhocoris]XP_015654049.1 hypothetical protein ABB37_08481 [Leptomonas pyrrhocoris]KPA75609.1 hypothetical protein ABB37_08481 [Leptomonas pyrrhocoris]KPA75610.1 hypothetical protein ABB37_08481 [Leptomonas pyrrhocoris]|eukprot:XP_015654048.1 hypothetical protein ABB37_08481 [Leptomonas pyrrhocoris]
MSAFTTPSRASTTHAAATQRAGSSSGRRVVRSALETLMDTATPELPGRAGNGISSATSSARFQSASAKRPAAAASSTSPFSVTYTRAPPGYNARGHPLSSSTVPHVPPAAPTTSFASSSATQTRNSSSGITAASSSKTLPTPAHREEPSALAFLSPQGKAARASSPSSVSRREERPQPSRRSSSKPHNTHAASAVSYDNDDVDGTHPSRSTRNARLKDRSRAPGASSSTPFAAPAAAPASPSRSLFSDVEAARQQQPQKQIPQNCEDVDDGGSPIMAAADTSFMDDSSEGDNDEDSTRVETEEEERRFRTSALRRRSNDGDGGDDVAVARVEAHASTSSAAIPTTEVERRIAAALRRYEKERDAEEEAVLRQVSDEVEAQATRYEALVAAYNGVCSDNTQLQEKLAAVTTARNGFEEALQNARQAQQAQRESMKRLEVELYHARDAQEDQRAQLQSESAEWEATRRRYERRHATLEAQLSQLRGDLQERDDRNTELIRQMEQQDKELSALRQRSSQRDTKAEDEYAEIHQRVLRLGQNMSTMEAALRERDDAIAHLQDQLAEATAANRDHADDVRLLQEEKEKIAAELASMRALAQKQTADVRKRMHRLSFVERQKDALRNEVGDARRTLSRSASEQAQVLKSLEDLVEEVKHLAADAAPRGNLSNGNTDGSDAGDVHGSGGHPAARTPAPDDTLVYEDDSNYSTVSDVEATTTSLVSAASRDSDRSDVDDDDHDGHGDVETPSSTPRQARTITTTTAAAAATAATAIIAKARKSKTASAAGDGGTLSVKRLSRLLHHDVARTHIVARELRRQVTELAKRQQQRRRQQRNTSPATSRSHSSTSTAPRTASADVDGKRRISGSASPLNSNSAHYTPQQRHDIVQKLEQACRYLKSQLSEAQAECQWRSLSMKKWEDDVQGARREVLHLEKERLRCTTEKETLELVKQELEEQLAEAQRRGAATAERCTAAEAALTEVKATLESTQHELEELAAAKKSAEAALEKEQGKSTHLAAQVTQCTAAQAALTDELAVLKDNHKATLSQLQIFRAQEATQQLKEEHDGRVRSSELSGLRTAVAQLRVAEGAWEAERVRLQSTVSALQNRIEGLKEEMAVRSQRGAALESAAALHTELESTTLRTIASIVDAPPFAWQEKKTNDDGAIPAPTTDARRASSSSSGYSGGAVVDVSPTEKKLFELDEPMIEEIVVEEDDRAVAAMVRTRLRQQQRRIARTPSSAARHCSSTTAAAATPTLRGTRSPSSTAAAAETCADASSAQLARLRQYVVTAVQGVALELVRLRALTRHGSSPAPALPSSQSTTHSARGGIPIPENDAAPAAAWFGATAGLEAQNRNPLPTPFAGEEVRLLDHRNTAVPFATPRDSTRVTPPHLPLPSLGSRSTSRDAQRMTTIHSGAAETPTAISKRRRNSFSSSPSPSQRQPAYDPSRRGRELAASTVHSPATEHVYNVSPWTPSQGLRSPSASPPMKETATAAAKVWSEVRRSASTEDGLSAYSSSATRGDVDGSGSPARPPSLRARPVTHDH